MLASDRLVTPPAKLLYKFYGSNFTPVIAGVSAAAFSDPETKLPYKVDANNS